MKHRFTLIALAGSVALLAGCGDSAGTDAFAGLDADLVAAAAGLVDPDTGALLAAERTSLPVAGSVTYDGYVGGEVDGAGMIGELSLDVAFAPGDNGTITGTADNFVHETDGAYTGTLTLNGGVVLPNAGAAGADLVAGDLQGTLTNGGTGYATDIALDGGFLGGTGLEDPDAMGGAATGTVGGEAFDGVFIAVSP